MFTIFKEDTRKLKAQVESYYQSKYGRFTDAAKRDSIYLEKLLELTEARCVTELTREDVRAYMKHFRESYASSMYIIGAGKAIRCFVREFRKQGYPTLMAWELKKLCNEYEPSY